MRFTSGDAFQSRDYESYLREFERLPFERILEQFRKRKLLEIIKNFEWGIIRNILEIGPGYNSVGLDIFPEAKKIILEPSHKLYLQNATIFSNFPNTEIINMDIADFTSEETFDKFDLVILSSVLHEFSDAQYEMKLVRNLMKVGASVLIVVPNNESVHRQFGVTLGLLMSTKVQTETEIKMQQNSSYSIDSLTRFVKELNFRVDKVETSFVKPHTHLQMQNWLDNGELTNSDLENLYTLSQIFHPFNAEIFMIASKI